MDRFEFESEVSGIPCIIRVNSYQPYKRGITSQLPENCEPPSGGVGEFDILYLDRRPAPKLEQKLNNDEYLDILEQMTILFNSRNPIY